MWSHQDKHQKRSKDVAQSQSSRKAAKPKDFAEVHSNSSRACSSSAGRCLLTPHHMLTLPLLSV